MDYLYEVQKLVQLLQLLRETDRDLRVFGAGNNGHQHILKPCLSAEEINQFEDTHNIHLPEDYRLFLQHVGNGGPGPDYGLTPLGQGHYLFPLEKPFIYTEEVDFAELPSESDNFGGILEVSDGGCWDYSYIVVNGPTYGRIWSLNEKGIMPTDLTFTQWYRNWLEGELRMLAKEPLAE